MFFTDVPHIAASGITIAAHGDTVTLECQVDAHPEPKMMFWRDHSGRVPVIQGGRHDIKISPTANVSMAARVVPGLRGPTDP